MHVPVAVPFLEDDYGGMIDARLRWHKVLEDRRHVHVAVLVVVHPLGQDQGNMLELGGRKGELDEERDAKDFCESAT